MTTSDLQTWIEGNPVLAFGAVILISIVLFFVTRIIIARGLTNLARRTETKVDDIIVNQLRPFRVALLAPLLVIFAFAYALPDLEQLIERAALFLILWVVAFTLNSLLETSMCRRI